MEAGRGAFVGSLSLARINDKLKWSERSTRMTACEEGGSRAVARLSRRELLSGVLAAVLASPVASLAAEPLPPGALQFNQLLKARRLWDEIGVAFNREGEIEAGEWDGTRGFIRKFYSAGEDMEYLAGGMSGETKKKGIQLSRDFRKFVRGLDKPLAAKDLDGFRKGQAEAANMITAFFSLLEEASDIPDEL